MKKRNIKAENERVEKDFPKNPENISKDELHEHFDLDQDGKVTLEEYAEHIDYHCENPGVLQDELDYERGFMYKDGGKVKELKEYLAELLKEYKENYSSLSNYERSEIARLFIENFIEYQHLTKTKIFKKGGLTPAKAKKMLKDGTAQGKPLTDKQRRYFYAVSNEKMKKGGETIKGVSFRQYILKSKDKSKANGLYIYNPYYKRFGYINDENLDKGKIPYRVKVHYNKTSGLGKGTLMNINDLIIVDERRYDKGGVLSGKELKKYIKKSDYYGNTSFLDNISDKDTYVLKNLDIDEQIKKDGTLRDFIEHDTEKYQPNENEAIWLNKEPVIVGSSQWEDNVVLDGYHRVKQAKVNKENKIPAFVKTSKFAKGGFVDGDIVRISQDNDNDNYDLYRNKDLEIIRVSHNTKDHPGYDESVSGMALYDLRVVDSGEDVPFSLYEYEVEGPSTYAKGGKTPNYDYDYEDIGQFSMKDDNWKYFTQEDFRDIGKEITETAFNGDLDVAYESIVKQRSSFEKGGMTKEDYLKKKFDVREFVDEDTGELVPIEIPIDRDKRVSKSYSPSERRRERKRELKDFQRMEELQDLQGDIDTLKYKLEDEKKYYDSLFVDQDVEAGQKGENWSDDDANRYGVMMNESAEKIAAIKLLIDKKQKEYNEKESSYSEFY